MIAIKRSAPAWHPAFLEMLPARVVVRRMNPNAIATVRSTKPDQVAEIWLNSRCSIGFHFDVPGG